MSQELSSSAKDMCDCDCLSVILQRLPLESRFVTMSSNGTKIVALRPNKWITWRDMISSMLKSEDLQPHLHDGADVLKEVDSE